MKVGLRNRNVRTADSTSCPSTTMKKHASTTLENSNSSVAEVVELISTTFAVISVCFAARDAGLQNILRET